MNRKTCPKRAKTYERRFVTIRPLPLPFASTINDTLILYNLFQSQRVPSLSGFIVLESRQGQLIIDTFYKYVVKKTIHNTESFAFLKIPQLKQSIDLIYIYVCPHRFYLRKNNGIFINLVFERAFFQIKHV